MYNVLYCTHVYNTYYIVHTCMYACNAIYYTLKDNTIYGYIICLVNYNYTPCTPYTVYIQCICVPICNYLAMYTYIAMPLCTLYTVHCTLYNIQYVHCTLYNIQYVHCTIVYGANYGSYLCIAFT